MRARAAWAAFLLNFDLDFVWKLSVAVVVACSALLSPSREVFASPQVNMLGVHCFEDVAVFQVPVKHEPFSVVTSPHLIRLHVRDWNLNRVHGSASRDDVVDYWQFGDCHPGICGRVVQQFDEAYLHQCWGVSMVDELNRHGWIGAKRKAEIIGVYDFEQHVGPFGGQERLFGDVSGLGRRMSGYDRRLGGYSRNGDGLLRFAGLSGGGFSGQFQLVIARLPEPVCGPFERERENGNCYRRNGGDSDAKKIQKRLDFESYVYGKAMGGAFFMACIIGLLAYFAIERDKGKESD